MFDMIRALWGSQTSRSFLIRASQHSLRRHYASNPIHNPLRILFCGSEDFSIASLRALHKEHVDHPDRIASIDVVCRPGKRIGRGWKAFREGKRSLSFKNLERALNRFQCPFKPLRGSLPFPYIPSIHLPDGWYVQAGYLICKPRG